MLRIGSPSLALTDTPARSLVVEQAMTNGGGPTITKGGFFTPEEKARYASLLTVFDPTAGLNRLDSYGKWIFGSASVVGALAAGLSNPAVSKLHGFAIWLFVFSVGAFGLSLVFASWSIAPHWASANIYGPQSLEDAVRKQMMSRKASLRWASILFALALFGAGLCPLMSIEDRTPNAMVHYSLDDKGNFTAELISSSEAPGARLELRLEASAASSSQLPFAAATAGQSGDVDLKLSLPQPGLAAVKSSVSLVGCRYLSLKNSCEELFRIPVKSS